MTADTARRPVQRRLPTYSNGSLRFDVRDQGPINAPVVVLLHGFPERASHWDAVAERLHAAGLRTMAPDQRGYSPGARPRTRASYRMSCLVDDVVALVREVGALVHVVGHDLGAAVGWGMAAAMSLLPRLLTGPLRASGLDEAWVRRVEEEVLAYGALPGALGWYRAAPLDAFAATPSITVPTTHV